MTEQPKSRPANVGKKLRNLYTWFEEVAKKAKERALSKRRNEFRKKGPELEIVQLLTTADGLEEIQRELNRLGLRHEEISAELLAHWGHTGVKEIESALGKTLVSASFKLTVDPATIQEGLTEAQWLRVTKRTLDAGLLLALGEGDEGVRGLIEKAMRALATVRITPPSSRRPKSGQPEGEEEEE